MRSLSCLIICTRLAWMQEVEQRMEELPSIRTLPSGTRIFQYHGICVKQSIKSATIPVLTKYALLNDWCLPSHVSRDSRSVPEAGLNALLVDFRPDKANHNRSHMLKYSDIFFRIWRRRQGTHRYPYSVDRRLRLVHLGEALVRCLILAVEGLCVIFAERCVINVYEASGGEAELICATLVIKLHECMIAYQIR